MRWRRDGHRTNLGSGGHVNISRTVATIGIAVSATLAAGVATAANPGAGSVQACENSHHVLLLKSHGKCPKNSHALSLNLKGPRGRRGPRGLTHSYATFEDPVTFSPGANTITSIFQAVPAGNYIGMLSLSTDPDNLPGGTYDLQCVLLSQKGAVGAEDGRATGRFDSSGSGPGQVVIPFGDDTRDGKLTLNCQSGGTLHLLSNVTLVPVSRID